MTVSPGARPSRTWDEVRARRMAAGHLAARMPADAMGAVVAGVGGIQAQVLSAAELAIAARVDVTVADVRRALWEDRSLVKTYGPRGTLHLLPADELPMWMAAMRTIRTEGAELWRALLHIEPAQEAELVAATRDALDGRVLTRDELAEAVTPQVGLWAHERLRSQWGDLLSPAALVGSLCFGPNRGAKVTFVRADQWIGGWAEVDGTSAVDEVARRFLRAYGPSRPAEFARWAGSDLATATRAFERLGAETRSVDVEGWAAVELVVDPDAAPPVERDVVRLLPQYDAFVIGSRPREHLVSPEVNDRIRSHRRGRLEGAVALSVVVVDGRIVGIWERSLTGRRVTITIELVDASWALGDALRDRLEAEARRVASALGRDAVVAFDRLD